MLKPVFLLLSVFLINSVAMAGLPDFTDMVETNGHAVVNISTTQKAPKPDGQGMQRLPDDIPPQMEEFFRRFFQDPRGLVPRDSKSLGSGFIISDDGYVITNHHVIKNADEIVVKLKDRRQIEAKLIGSDQSTDIALLKIDADDLPAVKIGSSGNMKVGEWVLAIGSPFGFEQSVTAGIVSAKGRSLPGGNYVPFIQTDVAINPGNSGGPLFNMKGEVIGVNSQIYSRSGGYMGLSFAIPMDVAMNVIEQIKDNGKVARGWLGVQIQDVTRELAESFEMDRPHGALVSKVVDESPAKKAGIKIGDIIVEFNGKNIETSGELPPVVGITPVNKKVKMKVIRQGKYKTLKVKVGLLPESEVLAQAHKAEEKVNRLGLVVAELSQEQRKKLEVESNGVLVQEVKRGPAMSAGIKRGDVILRIRNRSIKSLKDFQKTVEDLPTDKSIAVLVQRRGSPRFITLKLEK